MARTFSALTLLLLAGAMLVANAEDADFVSFQSGKWGASQLSNKGSGTWGVKFWFKGTTWTASEDSLQDLSGSGLWKLSLYASNTNDPDVEVTGTPDYEQVLSTAASSTPLVDGEVTVYGDLVDLTEMGCTDNKFVCFEFHKGSQEHHVVPYNGCLDFSGVLDCEGE